MDFGLGDAMSERGVFCSAEELIGLLPGAAAGLVQLARPCPGLSHLVLSGLRRMAASAVGLLSRSDTDSRPGSREKWRGSLRTAVGATHAAQSRQPAARAWHTETWGDAQSKPSLRILEEAVRVFPPRNQGEASQLTLL
jgi:hypothetical protein